MTDLVSAAVDLCRAVAPEIRDLAGPYIALASELWTDEEPTRGSDCYGWTTHHQDLHLRDYLRSQGRWQGRGPAFVMNDRLLTAEDYGDLLPVWFFGIALHELGHVLHEFLRRIREQHEDDIPTEAIKAQMELIAQVQTKTYAPSDIADAERRHHAPERFGRVAIHLAWRARNHLGLSKRDLPMCLVWQPPSYAAHVFENALGDEPERLQHETIETILRTPLPTGFARLCAELTASQTEE